MANADQVGLGPTVSVRAMPAAAARSVQGLREERARLRQQLQEGRTQRRQGRDRDRRRQPQRAPLHCPVRLRLSLQADGRWRSADPELPAAGRPDRAARQPDGRNAAFDRSAVADAALRVRARTVAHALPKPPRPGLRHHLDRLARRADARRESAQHRAPHRTRARRLSDRLHLRQRAAKVRSGRQGKRRCCRSPSSTWPIRSACRWSTPTGRCAS